MTRSITLVFLTIVVAACAKRAASGGAAPRSAGPRGDVRIGDVAPVGERSARGKVGAVGRVARGHASELRYCYNQALRTDPQLRGTLTFAVTLDRDGNVTRTEVVQRSWAGSGGTSAESCMTRQIRGWLFPNASTGTFRFPVEFSR